MRRRLHRDDYKIAWICAIDSEQIASIRMLNERHEPPGYDPQSDDNLYHFGDINSYNIVIATLPIGETGNVNAARLTGPMFKTFRNITMVLLVGIGGGIPRPNPGQNPYEDIRLGDVVVGLPGDGKPACIHYDRGRVKVGEFEQLGTIPEPVWALKSAVSHVFIEIEMGEIDVSAHVKRLKNLPKYNHPGRQHDQLFDAGCHHVGAYNDCSTCDTDRLIPRPSRNTDDGSKFVVHKGRIMSGQSLIMDGEYRDLIAKHWKGAMCIEMEAAGVSVQKECLVIRGISDYADAHKGDKWRWYAAGNAAAFARELVCSLTPASNTDVANAKLVAVAEVTAAAIECLESLAFVHMSTRSLEIQEPTPKTLEWTLSHRTYLSWIRQEPNNDHPELLWIKGKPGSGKSVAIKSLAKSVQKSAPGTFSCCASFFFDRKRAYAETARFRFYRSFLHQLAKHELSIQASLLEIWREKIRHRSISNGDTCPPVIWEETELENILESLFKSTSMPSTLLLVDAVDECGTPSEARRVVAFCLRLLAHARDSDVKLSICISCRSNFTVGRGGHTTVLDQLNESDIRAYTTREMELHGTSLMRHIVEDVVRRSSGIFLWVKLVVDMLLWHLDQGRSLDYLRQSLDELSPDLEHIYQTMLAHSDLESDKDRTERLRFFQWVIFANRPLQLREWQSIIGMIQDPVPSSYQEVLRATTFSAELRDPTNNTTAFIERWIKDREERAELLVKRIRSISRGLVEVSQSPDMEDIEGGSSKAFQGSMCSYTGESRTVHVIHVSVYDFFLKETFGGLLPKCWTREQIVAEGHANVIMTCSNFLNMKELDRWIRRGKAAESRSSYKRKRPQLWSSEDMPFSFSAAMSCRSSSRGSSESIESMSSEPLHGESLSGMIAFDSDVTILGLREVRTGLAKQISPFEYLPHYSNDYVLHEWRRSVATDGASETPEDLTNIQTAHIKSQSYSSGVEARRADLVGQEKSSGMSVLASGRSVQLGVGDLTSLLQYATDEIFNHARNSDLQNIKLKWLAKTLVSAWSRIIWLPSDISSGTDMFQFFTDAGLESLVIPALECENYTGSSRGVFDLACRLFKQEILVGLVTRQLEILSKWPRYCIERGFPEEKMSPASSKQDEKVVDSNAGTLQLAKKYDAMFLEQNNSWRCWIVTCQKALEKELVDLAMIQHALEGRWHDFWPAVCQMGDVDIVRLVLGWVTDCEDRAWYAEAMRYFIGWGRPLGEEYIKIFEVFVRNESISSGSTRASTSEVDNRPLLHHFCHPQPDPAIIKMLLAQGANPNHRTDQGWTALHHICDTERTGWYPPKFWHMCYVLNTLVQHGADVNCQDDLGRTPAHYLSLPGKFYTLIPLLKMHGADLKLKDRAGAAPLYKFHTLSYMEGHHSERRWSSLLKYRPETSQNNGDRTSFSKCFVEACQSWSSESAPEYFMIVYSRLSSSQSEINVIDENGLTPLLYACKAIWWQYSGEARAIQKLASLLIAHGAKLNTTDKAQRTALHWAASSAQSRVIKSIVARDDEIKFAINMADLNGNTPLHLAVQDLTGVEGVNHVMTPRRRTCLLLLLENGADLFKKNAAGLTPLQILKDMPVWHKRAKQQLITILEKAEETALQGGDGIE